MTVLAIGDGHLKAGDKRDPQRWRALAQILAHAEALAEAGELFGVVWLGDLLHAESSIEDRNAIAPYLQALAGLAEVVIIKGNHDRPGDLDIFGRLRARYPITVVSAPRVHVILREGQQLAVACLPYPQKGALVAAGIPASEIAAALHRAMTAIFLQLAEGLAQFEARGYPSMFAGHVTIGGAELSIGQPLIGQDIQIDATHLALLPPHAPKVLGHIHKPQELYGAHYAGSIAAVDYGEIERKRFLELSLGLDGAWRVVSVPLEGPLMFHVEGEASPAGFAWRVRKGPEGAETPAPASWRGADVRVRFRFKASDQPFLDTVKAEILATFAEAASLQLEPVAIAEREIRAPRVIAAASLADKVQAWGDAASYEITEGALAKLAALETEPAEALLAGVHAAIVRRRAPRKAPPDVVNP